MCVLHTQAVRQSFGLLGRTVATLILARCAAGEATGSAGRLAVSGCCYSSNSVYVCVVLRVTSSACDQHPNWKNTPSLAPKSFVAFVAKRCQNFRRALSKSRSTSLSVIRLLHPDVQISIEFGRRRWTSWLALLAAVRIDRGRSLAAQLAALSTEKAGCYSMCVRVHSEASPSSKTVQSGSANAQHRCQQGCLSACSRSAVLTSNIIVSRPATRDRSASQFFRGGPRR